MTTKPSKRLELVARRKDVAQLYMQGHTQMQIAERLGYCLFGLVGHLAG